MSVDESADCHKSFYITLLPSWNKILIFTEIYGWGAHILDFETIGFITSGLGQLSTSDNWPQARLASQTIGSMKSWKNQNINLLLILHNNLHIHSKTYPKEASKAAKCRRLPGLPKVRWNPTSSGNFVRSQKTTLGNFSCLSFTI